MMAIAIVEHNLPYAFVEYRRVRDALAYANSSIEFWSRNTAVSDVLRIFEKEKANLRKVLTEVPGRNIGKIIKLGLRSCSYGV